MYSIPRDHIADDGNSSRPPMYTFCLPGHEFLLTTSAACLCSAMSFYTTEIGSYPLGSYKLAFVDEMPTQRSDSSTFPPLTVELLHAEDAIEQPLKTRHALSHVRQAAAEAAEGGGDTEAAEGMGMVDMGFGPEMWEKESERNNWKVEDWTEEDETVMSGATYEWIRMDTDFEWIAGLKFEQQNFMWVSQLQRDRDVVAQLEVWSAQCLT
jgi:hypothetical protein